MSLVPTWVLAVDGQFYENPIFKGNGWFLCFDDDDPPELVIRMEEGASIDNGLLRMLAIDILNDLELGYHILAKPRPTWALRCFTGITDMKYAGSVFIQITEPIPVPTEYDRIGDLELVLMGDCVIYDFGKAGLCQRIR